MLHGSFHYNRYIDDVIALCQAHPTRPTVAAELIHPTPDKEARIPMCTAELRSWLDAPDPKRFPYRAVIRVYHSVGKHFVPADVLGLLGAVRDVLPLMPGPWRQLRTLAAFLDIALSKPDNRYDYPTYLALGLLELPTIDDHINHVIFARSRCDRLLAHLITDVMGFELSALEGQSTLLPMMRPARELVIKRIRHGLRAIQPALARMALGRGLRAADPIDQARRVCGLVRADMSFAEQRSIELSVIPLSTMHDEYLFLRMLQTLEVTFALLATHLHGAIAALKVEEIDRSVKYLDGSADALIESAPLFSMLATTQIESFRTFRHFTEGGGTMQSRNYRIVEALRRRLDDERIGSLAHRSVAGVHSRVLVDDPTLDSAYVQVCRSSNITAADKARLTEAIANFSDALIRWHRTHDRLAVRMAGSASGTGHTKGTPHLATVRDIPVCSTALMGYANVQDAADREDT
jgi:tryptophan 2,3-dioxygenase